MDKIKKWSPVLNILGIKKEYYECFSNLAEQQLTQNKGDYIPIALKIASQLKNLETLINKNNVIFTDKPIKKQLIAKVLFKHSYISDMEHLSVLLKDTMQDLAIEYSVENIDKLLHGANKIEIYSLCSEIKLEDSVEGQYVCVYADFEISGTREDKIKRIISEI